MVDLNALNKASKNDFINYLDGVYEHAPWVAELAFNLSPFTTVDELHKKMQQCVLNSPQNLKHTLICNHPELAGKEAKQGSLTQASLSEQKNSGLTHCSAEELMLFKKLNADYRTRFGFPFIVAVKGLTRHDILDLMQQRMNNSKQQEFDTCIDQIGKIAKFRLIALIKNNSV